jgi:tRNA-splicing ligase RtcB (3'-phosphate/5'-hydroxy nucleic acid ligase)
MTFVPRRPTEPPRDEMCECNHPFRKHDDTWDCKVDYCACDMYEKRENQVDKQNYMFERRGSAIVKHWTQGVTFDHNAREQVFQTAELPHIFKHVAVMPDVHLGVGATVGTVFAMKGAIVPAAVGVDIGCGMLAERLAISSSALGDNAEHLRAAIEAAIPVGNSSHDVHRTPDWSRDAWANLMEVHIHHPPIELLHAKQGPIQQIGTLGGGNHFVELCLDESDQVWLMLHSGSRGLGNRIGRHYIDIAKRECERWGVKLPNKDLAWLPEGTPHFDEYMRNMVFAQDYATYNREVMRRLAVWAIAKALDKREYDIETGMTAINCHHNYVSKENHFGENVLVTRKGAVRARKGDLGIIPGSMGARSYIVSGLGNPESFMSCSHGAGRVMSRGEAKKQITLEMHAIATKGVACRKDEGVLDESPAAYKNVDDVMQAQSDLVEIVHELRAIVCVKG